MIRPLGERVVVKPMPSEEKTKSGIVLPDTAKEKPQEGEVVAVGTGRLLETGQRVPIDLKPGDKILFSKYSGNEVKIDDVDYLIMRESDILGVIE
ncbi:MAG: 10 kDa chaperonin [Pelotomaculum sp. PtaB.Bin104]|nr:MAG: 10 kDa chaperonin [Pelotomaculum sp. PtaB.Bin104]